MRFIRGDTFDLSGSVEVIGVDDLPVDLSTWTVSSKIRFADSKRKVTLTATWLDVGHTLIRISLADTTAWPLGSADVDVQFTSPSGHKVTTETSKLTIVEGVSGA